MTLYKITGPAGEPLLANSHDLWPLPKGDKPGAWTRKRTPELCESGWHLMPVEGLSNHVAIGTLWEAEGRGAMDSDGTKVAYESARLVRRIGEITHPLLVSVACDWAEHGQPVPVLEGSRAALDAARAWVACPCDEHANAATNAARAAHANAATNAARAAHAYAAYAAASAGDAAYAATAAAYAATVAADAATVATYAAVNAAAYAAATVAADAAVNAAAYAAASAGDAAYAANAAAYAATYAAERRWQGERLLEVVGS